MNTQSGKIGLSKFPLRLMPSVRHGAEEFAAKEGVSLNQFSMWPWPSVLLISSIKLGLNAAGRLRRSRLPGVVAPRSRKESSGRGRR